MGRAAALLLASSGRIAFVEKLTEDLAAALERESKGLPAKYYIEKARSQMRIAENEANVAMNLLTDAKKALTAAIDTLNTQLRELEKLEREGISTK